MQLTLDFSKQRLPALDNGKKRQRIAVACSDEFKEFFQTIASLMKTNESELAYGYILEGMKSDLGNIFLPQPHLDKSLKEILKQFG